MANHISRSSEPVYVGNYLPPNYAATTADAASTCFPLLSDQLLVGSPVNSGQSFLLILEHLPLWLLERFCQRQHGCDSPLTPRPPSSIRFIKGELRPEQVLFMSCPLPASIQQLWHPRERVGRTPESDFLSAGEVAQHPDSSRGEK